jgi:hypothetical protein
MNFDQFQTNYDTMKEKNTHNKKNHIIFQLMKYTIKRSYK